MSMNGIRVTVCDTVRVLSEGTTLKQAIEAFSPYGDEAVICRLNGTMVRSIDDTASQILRDGDILMIYPLIIGG